MERSVKHWQAADDLSKVNERDLPDLSSSSVQWQCHKLLSRILLNMCCFWVRSLFGS